MERLHGDLLALKDRIMRIPEETKQHISRRLLIQVLCLQQADVTHSDLKLSNCFMRIDGTFFLGDYGTSAPFGEPVSVTVTLTPASVEPNLLLDYLRAWRDRVPLTSHPGIDMWALGGCVQTASSRMALRTAVNLFTAWGLG